ncbi:pyruvate kinase [Mycobacterium tuberculosis]|nr:pyruvate kinase [Mycobacterium tuberculosis]
MTRRGKIVCTLGPATQRDDLVRALVEAGMDVARMNFSHGDYDDHKVAYERVRVASDATGRAVGVLADLQGPKIRLGRFASGATHWAEGETVRITVGACEGSHDRVSTTYKRLAQDAVAGDRVLVDDGQTSPRADGKTIHTENPHFYQNFIHEFGMSRSRRHVTAASHRASV